MSEQPSGPGNKYVAMAAVPATRLVSKSLRTAVIGNE
jgi:hypothetical protein